MAKFITLTLVARLTKKDGRPVGAWRGRVARLLVSMINLLGFEVHFETKRKNEVKSC